MDGKPFGSPLKWQLVGAVVMEPPVLNTLDITFEGRLTTGRK